MIALLPALSDEQIDDPKHILLAANELQNCGSDADVIIMIDRSKISCLIVETHFLHLRRRTQAKLQTQIVGPLVDMLLLGNSTVWNGI